MEIVKRLGLVEQYGVHDPRGPDRRRSDRRPGERIGADRPALPCPGAVLHPLTRRPPGIDSRFRHEDCINAQ
ncbi:MAG: hypothetical protein MZV70_05085 [Desulfobacterales bacterium]|nr:hypothetical protein [Desulfobacterales bacterium]